jgi:hypothetical protein
VQTRNQGIERRINKDSRKKKKQKKTNKQIKNFFSLIPITCYWWTFTMTIDEGG